MATRQKQPKRQPARGQATRTGEPAPPPKEGMRTTPSPDIPDSVKEASRLVNWLSRHPMLRDGDWEDFVQEMMDIVKVGLQASKGETGSHKGEQYEGMNLAWLLKVEAKRRNISEQLVREDDLEYLLQRVRYEERDTTKEVAAELWHLIRAVGALAFRLGMANGVLSLPAVLSPSASAAAFRGKGRGKGRGPKTTIKGKSIGERRDLVWSLHTQGVSQYKIAQAVARDWDRLGEPLTRGHVWADQRKRYEELVRKDLRYCREHSEERSDPDAVRASRQERVEAETKDSSHE